MGWEAMANGRLLRTAHSAGFEAIISTDKNIEHEQNLATLPLQVIVIDAPSNALPALLPFVPHLLELLGSSLNPALYILRPDGSVTRLTSPRP
jgi:hypothetical protein